jgi:hypothetical protein
MKQHMYKIIKYTSQTYTSQTYTSQTYTFLYHEKHNSKNYFKKYKIITNLLNK